MKNAKRFLIPILAFSLLASTTHPVEVKADTTKTVKTQKQLEKALKNGNVDVVNISTTTKVTLTIPKGTFDKELIIKSPNANIINKGSFENITIKDSKKFTEKAKGNSLNVKDNKLTLNVDEKSSVKSLKVSNKNANISLVADGTVKKITLDSAKAINIKGEHGNTIKVISNAKGVTIKANSAVTVTMNKDGNIVANVEDVKIINGNDGVVTKVTNNTEIIIVVVDKNNEIVSEVKEGESSKVSNKDKEGNGKDNNNNSGGDKETGKDKEDKTDKDNKTDDKNNNDKNNNNSNSSTIYYPPTQTTDKYTVSGNTISYKNNVYTINYEILKNGTKITALPQQYSIKNVATGGTIKEETFGKIEFSVSSENPTLQIQLINSGSVVASSNITLDTSQYFDLNDINKGRKLSFSYWNSDNLYFNTFVGHNHYSWISSDNNADNRLSSTSWQVANAGSNIKQNDKSLVWNDLSSSTDIGGVLDSKYYNNSYRLTFNKKGTYYLRAKVGEDYVYSGLITVNDWDDTNTKFQDVQFGENTYKAHIFNNSVNTCSISFYINDFAPEEINEKFSSVNFIKYYWYKDSDCSVVGTYNESKSSFSSYCIVVFDYTEDAFYKREDGSIYSKRYYDSNKKYIKGESYDNGKLTQAQLQTYDEEGRSYSHTTINYNEDGEETSRTGYYYTYDESGNQIFHNGFPPTT